MTEFPVSYSSLNTKSLLKFAIDEYEINPKSTIKFIKRGFNDTYLITEPVDKRYIFRIYNHNWRSSKSIEPEIDLLRLLDSKRINVSVPLINKKNEYYGSISAPEGERYFALFTYAEGIQARKLNSEQSFLLGKETGKIHSITKGLVTENAAQIYDIDFQLNKTLDVIKPILDGFEEEYNYFNQLKADFQNTFSEITKEELVSGICHGDLQAENIHFTQENKLTLFDFDFMGTGYLVYDIGVFIWYDHKNKPKEIIDSFIAGYESERKLTMTEKKLLPYFSTLRALFQMTIYCELNDGNYLPQWAPQQVADFIKKVKKWHEKEALKIVR